EALDLQAMRLAVSPAKVTPRRERSAAVGVRAQFPVANQLTVQAQFNPLEDFRRLTRISDRSDSIIRRPKPPQTTAPITGLKVPFRKHGAQDIRSEEHTSELQSLA